MINGFIFIRWHEMRTCTQFLFIRTRLAFEGHTNTHAHPPYMGLGKDLSCSHYLPLLFVHLFSIDFDRMNQFSSVGLFCQTHSHTSVGLSTKCHTQLTNWHKIVFVRPSWDAWDQTEFSLRVQTGHSRTKKPTKTDTGEQLWARKLNKRSNERTATNKLNDDRIRLIIIYKLCAYISLGRRVYYFITLLLQQWMFKLDWARTRCFMGDRQCIWRLTLHVLVVSSMILDGYNINAID